MTSIIILFGISSSIKIVNLFIFAKSLSQFLRNQCVSAVCTPSLLAVSTFTIQPVVPSSAFTRIDVFQNLHIALQILLKIAVSIASCKRSSSKLKLIFQYLQASMVQQPLVDLAILSVESETLEPADFDAVIDKFAAVKARKKSCSSSAYEYLENGVKWDTFKDGFPNLFIDNVKHITNANVVLLASFHNPQVIFEQLSLIYAIPRYMAKSFTLVLPYFPTGTMERVDLEGQIATAKTLAQLLSAIPLTGRGPAQILIFDIHALQERFYFSDTVIPRLETAFTLLSKEIVSLQEDGTEEIAIAFPDEGAYKRFHVWVGSLPNVSLVVCTKVREENRRVVKIKEGNPSKRHVIIVDDLVQSGGTIIECAKVLLEAGASKISAFATHAVFPCDSWKQFVEDPVVRLEHFWITDSLPLSSEISKHPPFKLLSLDQIIVKALLCD